MKKPLIILTGPTAAGKTKLSIALAKAIHGEIISADSMQVYRYMDIGSAKIRPEEMEGVPHYLVDILEPTEAFNVVQFQEMATQAIRQIYANGHIPILTGGTGFYIQAVLYDIQFETTPVNTAFRQELQLAAKKNGAQYLHDQLQKVDPRSASEIHANNVKRVVRALEYFHQTGQPISEHNEKERTRESPYNFAYFVLNDERGHLYEKIDRRVDDMMKCGLLEEVQSLKRRGYTREMVSMQGLGYKELLAYLEGECSLEEAVRMIKRDTRHFAKRQLTWFRRERDVIWIEQDTLQYDTGQILDKVLDACHKRGVTLL
ncbi:MAG: tRNA (adenosine(37)-N6)-dimethylallyltransferase MiaA [Hespellia sp.]|nr:tRNA (adenosine(37)-N6)-dimethylallyltransferase MiaA [Hespellia sp.]